MKILSLLPFLVSSLCPCKFSENGIQFEFTGSRIEIQSRSSTSFNVLMVPARTFSSVKYRSEGFGFTVERTESDCMVFNVFGKVNFN